MLDTIRLLANPEERWRAHLTVRGPYLRQLGAEVLARYNEGLRGNVVTVDGVDQFANALPNQHTVFFHCTGSRLRPVWHKPSFPGYTPHITLYDGDRPEVARQLLHFAQLHPFSLRFTAEKLEPMRSIKGQQRMDVGWNYLEVEGPANQHISFTEARSRDISSRLQLIQPLFARLSALSVK